MANSLRVLLIAFSKAIVSRSSVMSSLAERVTMYPSARVTRPWIPSPSTPSVATRLQSTPSGPWPMIASATSCTCSVVSSIQAWSSSSFLAFALAPPPPFAFCLLMMLAMSSRLFARVTVTFFGSRILSLQLSFVIFSVIVVPNSGSGTRHFRQIVSLSSGSPVSWLRSTPSTVIVTVGSQWFFSRSSAHRFSSALSFLLLSVSILQIVP